MVGTLLKFCSICITLLALTANISGCEKSETEEEKVAVKVGKRTITLKQFEEALKLLLPEGTSDVKADELRNLKSNLLSQLIEEELVIEEARRMGIDVSEEELASEVMSIRQEYGEGEFREVVVSRYGDLENWKDEIRRKILVRKVVGEVMEARVEVTDEEARSYYEENIKDYVVPEQIHARMIVVSAEKEARKVKGRLRKEDFSEVAIEVSISPEGKKGGDLGFFGRGDMPLEFEEVVFKLPVGKISDIVKTPYGYHVFKVVERKDGRKLKFKDVKDKIVEKLRREEAEKEFHRWIASLKKKTKIEVRGDIL
jgi:parvulin-like peptidyl-prolyl isomerase